MKSTVSFKCDALIDQGRHIGDDPVGYKCSGDAVVELGEGGPLLCADCQLMIKTHPERVSFCTSFGKAIQLAMLENVIELLKSKTR